MSDISLTCYGFMTLFSGVVHNLPEINFKVFNLKLIREYIRLVL